MKRSLFEKFEEKRILKEHLTTLVGGDYSTQTGDNESTGQGTDCGDFNRSTIYVDDVVNTSTNSDMSDDGSNTYDPTRPGPITSYGLFKF